MLMAVHKVGRPADEFDEALVLGSPFGVDMRGVNLTETDASQERAKGPEGAIGPNERRDPAGWEDRPIEREVWVPAEVSVRTSSQPIANGLLSILAVHDEDRGRDMPLDCVIEDTTRRLSPNAVIVGNDRERAGQDRGSSLGWWSG
jgi:hypothetical protein